MAEGGGGGRERIRGALPNAAKVKRSDHCREGRMEARFDAPLLGRKHMGAFSRAWNVTQVKAPCGAGRQHAHFGCNGLYFPTDPKNGCAQALGSDAHSPGGGWRPGEQRCVRKAGARVWHPNDAQGCAQLATGPRLRVRPLISGRCSHRKQSLTRPNTFFFKKRSFPFRLLLSSTCRQPNPKLCFNCLRGAQFHTDS